MHTRALLAFIAVACLWTAPAGRAATAPTTPFGPNDTFFSTWAWPAEQVDLLRAWGVTLGDPRVTIAIVDTGVSPVADLANELVPGVNLLNPSAPTTDDNGHGTEVASVAAAQINNDFGIAGVCGRCSIMPVKVADAAGNADPATVARGIAWAVDHGARVVNVSLNGRQDTPALDAAVAAAVTRGAVVVLAAGNTGSSDPAAGGYPAAACPTAIRVGADDTAGVLYPWSNRGSWVDLAAPGALAAIEPSGNVLLGQQGTSLAAAMVSGAAGLLLSQNPSLSPDAVKHALLSSANPGELPVLDVAAALGDGSDVHATVASVLAAAQPAAVKKPAAAKTQRALKPHTHG